MRREIRDVWKHQVGANVAAVLAALNPKIRGWATTSHRRRVSHLQQPGQLDVPQGSAVGQPDPSAPAQRLATGQVLGALHPKRTDTWVFGNKDVGAYLLKFKWFRIERHVVVRGTASPDDPSLRAYWLASSGRTPKISSPVPRSSPSTKRPLPPLWREPLQWRSAPTAPLDTEAQGWPDTYDNLALLHYYCHPHVHAHT